MFEHSLIQPCRGQSSRGLVLVKRGVHPPPQTAMT